MATKFIQPQRVQGKIYMPGESADKLPEKIVKQLLEDGVITGTIDEPEKKRSSKKGSKKKGGD